MFGLPGVGNLVVSAVLRRDYPVIQGALLVISGVYVLINLGVDLLYAVLDPRVRTDDATSRCRRAARSASPALLLLRRLVRRRSC